MIENATQPPNASAENRGYLRDLLRLRQDKRYRMGLLQGAVSFGVITQREWERFVWQVNAGRKAPKG